MKELFESCCEWHPLHQQKASYCRRGLVFSLSWGLSSPAPAAPAARTVMGSDSSLAAPSHCSAVITSFLGRWEMEHFKAQNRQIRLCLQSNEGESCENRGNIQERFSTFRNISKIYLIRFCFSTTVLSSPSLHLCLCQMVLGGWTPHVPGDVLIGHIWTLEGAEWSSAPQYSEVQVKVGEVPLLFFHLENDSPICGRRPLPRSFRGLPETCVHCFSRALLCHCYGVTWLP